MSLPTLFPLVHSRRWPLVARLSALVFLTLFLAAVWRVAHLYEGVKSRVVAHALAFITVQAAMLALLVAGLMAGKAAGLARERVLRLRRERLEYLLTDVLLFDRDEGALLAECRRHPAQARQVFGAVFGSLRGEVRQKSERIFFESGLYAGALPEVMSPDPVRALAAIALIREVDRADARKAVNAALEHPLPIVQLGARVAIMKNGGGDARRRVLDEAGGLPFWQRLALFYFAPNDSGLIGEFVSESLASGDDERVLGALEFLLASEKAFPLPGGLPERLEQARNPEVRIKLFKVLPLLCEGREALPVLQRGLADADWRVRSMAARASGALRIRDTSARLLEMVASPANAVELSHAARAVVAASGDVPADLERLAHACAKENRAALAEVLESARR